MRRKFKLENLDCANCAAKMENAIQKIDGVQAATVSFMSQRLTLEADEECFDRVLTEALAVCKKIEPDCKIIA